MQSLDQRYIQGQRVISYPNSANVSDYIASTYLFNLPMAVVAVVVAAGRSVP